MTAAEERRKAEYVKWKQERCAHVFAKGLADYEAHCVHCGLPASQFDPMALAAYSP